MIESGTINDILQSKGATVLTVSPDTTVYAAIQLMADKNVGSLLVTDGDKLMGIMSERDYTRKVVLKGRSSRDTAVKAILSENVVCISPTDTIEDGLRLMTDHRVRHLPVVDGSKIVGVVSIGDLVNWVISAQRSTIHQLESYISGFPTPPA